MKSTRPTAQIREQVESSRLRERRTESLYRLSRQLAGASGSEFLVTMAGRQVQEILGGEVVVLLPDDRLLPHKTRKLQVRRGDSTNQLLLLIASAVAERQHSLFQIACPAVFRWATAHERLSSFLGGARGDSQTRCGRL